jgi:hypothetical protein
MNVKRTAEGSLRGAYGAPARRPRCRKSGHIPCRVCVEAGYDGFWLAASRSPAASRPPCAPQPGWRSVGRPAARIQAWRRSSRTP